MRILGLTYSKASLTILLIWYSNNQIARKDATRPKGTWYYEICHIEGHLSTIHLKPLIACSKGKAGCVKLTIQNASLILVSGVTYFLDGCGGQLWK